MRTEYLFQKFSHSSVLLMIVLIVLFITQSSALVAKSFSKAERLVVVGSTTMLPLSEQLASRYKSEVGIDVLVQGGGSTAGVNAVLNDIAHVGASSRELSTKEKKYLDAFVVGRDALAIVVHPSNPINNISLENLRKVLAGEITSWKELGAAFDNQIQLVNDSAGAGTRAAMEELVMKKGGKGEKKTITLKSVVANSSAEMKANIANLKYAIGYLPFNYLDNTVKPISIDHVSPSYAAAYKGEYPLFRDLHYVIKKGSAGLGRAYIYFVLSPEGQDIVVKEGFLPVKLITSIEDLVRISKDEEYGNNTKQ